MIQCSTDEHVLTLKSRQERLRSCAAQAFKPALKTALWLLSITVPVSFAVLLLKLTGALFIIAKIFEPVFSWLGLPGESAIVFATACFLNIYSCIAVIETLGLAGRAVTILALMCLISHNLPVESAVQKRTGSSFIKLILVRLLASFAGAFLLNLFLPADAYQTSVLAVDKVITNSGFLAELKIWFLGISFLCIKIIVLVLLLMVLQRILEEFGVTKLLSRLMRYPLMILGVPHEAAFLWIVANTLGLAYGAGVIIDHIDRGCLSDVHADILNYHIAISHSMLEDTLLFMAIGVSIWWITIPRVILAAIAVWLKRLVYYVNTK